MLVCPNSTLGSLSVEMLLKSSVKISASFFTSGSEWCSHSQSKMLHGLHFSASLAARVRVHTEFEGFVVCPDCSVEDLKRCFTSFGGEREGVSGDKCH
jgi:hypothetical protein